MSYQQGPGYGPGGGQGPHPGYGAAPGYGQAGYRPIAPPPKKKGMSGCLMALLIVTALFVVGGTGVGIWAYIEFGEFIGAAGDATKVMLAAQSAPGTEELRELGCTQAIALDMKELTKVAQRFEDEMAKREGRKAKPLKLDEGASHFVQCKAGLTSKLTCSQVAKTYIKAVKPHARIVVTVQGAAAQAQCSESFDENGESLGKADAPDLPGN